MSRSMFMAAAIAATLAPVGQTRAQSPDGRPPARPPVSAPIANIRYGLTFDTATAADQVVKVTMTFDVQGTAPVLLSLPTWTPGAYEVSNFARHVSEFEASGAGQELRWDKLDYDSWRVRPTARGEVTVSFDFAADSLDNAMAWSRPDFLMVNGTNVFPYAEGRSLDFGSRLTINTQNGWRIASGLHSAGAPGVFAERSYHDLVDMPIFVGRFDIDSMLIAGKWTRLATYPAGVHTGQARADLWREFTQFIPAHAAVFGETPWDDYTQLIIYAPYGGISALEHQNSNLAVSDPQFIGSPILTNVLAHEVFHAWNVKRLRPADMVPYRYDVAQPTTLLWVSEGFTDYYADLGTVRGGTIDSLGFLRNAMGHIGVVEGSPAVSVEDASLSIWIHPTDGTDALYYDKGSVVGLLLDILIRDASDNRGSLDRVLRGLYESGWKRGRGFTNDEFWAAVSREAGGRSFQGFYVRYVDGRDSLPYDSVLPLAGMRIATQTTRVPRMGVSTQTGPDTVSVVTGLVPNGAFAQAGVQVGDALVTVGGIDQKRDVGADEFRRRFAGREGESYPVVVRRGGQELTLTARVRLGDNLVTRLEFDPAAGTKAGRIRAGILQGRVGN